MDKELLEKSCWIAHAIFAKGNGFVTQYWFDDPVAVIRIPLGCFDFLERWTKEVSKLTKPSLELLQQTLDCFDLDKELKEQYITSYSSHYMHKEF